MSEISTKNYLIFTSAAGYFTDEYGEKHFLWPKFKLQILKGKPCSTVWLWDWILDFGYIHVFKRSEAGKARRTEAS